MQLQPNQGKNLIIQVDGRKFERWPIKTKLITSEDKDIVLIVEEFARPHIKTGDILFISEKAVAITQGRSYPIKDIKASWLAKFLSYFVMKTPVGIGLGSPETMQLAIEEVGVARIFVSAIIGGLGKIVGLKGLFYILAGNGARSIDGAVDYALPPYNTYVSKGPKNAEEVAQKIAEKLGVKTAIVDANDLGVNILGFYSGAALDKSLASQSKKLIARVIKDNPLGQSDEQTPIGIIREIYPQVLDKTVKNATLSDFQNILDIARLLSIDIPNFVWSDKKYIEKQIKRGEYFLIQQDGAVAGIMSLRERNNKMHIETLAVKKEFQSKGLGTIFIEFAKLFSKEKGFKTLHAYSFYEYNMADFYVKKGFTMLEFSGDYNNHSYHCFEIKLS